MAGPSEASRIYFRPCDIVCLLSILPAAPVSTTPCCLSLPLGTRISSSGTTFGWLQDVLFMHVQGIVLPWAQLINRSTCNHRCRVADTQAAWRYALLSSFRYLSIVIVYFRHNTTTNVLDKSTDSVHQLFITNGYQGRFREVVSYEGWNSVFWQFYYQIITQIVYVIVTFKSTISTLSMTHIAHISTPTHFKCFGIWSGTLCLYANQYLNRGITMTIPHIAAADGRC